MPFNIGPLQLVLILLILLVVFGARRLPEIGRALGSSAREFKDGITGESKPDEPDSNEKAEAESVPELSDGASQSDADPVAEREKQETKT